MTYSTYCVTHDSGAVLSGIAGVCLKTERSKRSMPSTRPFTGVLFSV